MSFLRIAYVRAIGKACKYEKEFKQLLQDISLNSSTILVNLKSQDSYLDKLQRKNNDPSQIHDVLRAAILTTTKDEIKLVVNNLKRECAYNKAYKIYDIDYKDYPNNIGYMGSCHVKVQIHECIYEIQIMPEELWSAKEITHSFYKSMANNQQMDDSVKRFSNQVFGIASKSYEEYI